MLELMKMHHIDSVNNIDISQYVDNPNNYFIGDNFLYTNSKRPKWACIIAGARVKDDISRREAAIKLGISPKELKYIEKGKKNLTKSLAVKMAKIYAVPIMTLWKYAV